MQKITTQPLESHIYVFPQEPPPPFMAPDGLHPYTCEMATKAFAEMHDTDEMVPTVVFAVHDAERKLVCWPLPWRGADEKVLMLNCLRAVFAQPEHRPDRYSFQSEVWMANVSAEEAKHLKGPVSAHPERVDGLVVVTVDPKREPRCQIAAFVRSEDGTVTPWDKAGPEDAGEFGGRLGSLLDPPDPDTKLAFMIVNGEKVKH